jgi:hypothetical protein
LTGKWLLTKEGSGVLREPVELIDSDLDQVARRVLNGIFLMAAAVTATARATVVQFGFAQFQRKRQRQLRRQTVGHRQQRLSPLIKLSLLHLSARRPKPLPSVNLGSFGVVTGVTVISGD